MKRIHMKLAAVPLACLFVTVAACGGGGGDSTPASTAATAPDTGASTPKPASTGSAMLSGTTDPGPDVGQDGDFYLNTATWMLFGPKANGVWPAGVSIAGPAGGTGAQGNTGSGGNTGLAGNTILSGSVDPTDGVGNNGDYYINTSTSTLFGPKADGTWPPGVPLGGGTGSSGAGGGIVLAGAGAPDNSVGNNGDYYLDTNTWTLYGPKANDQWPAGVSLVGQPGGGTGGTGGTDGTGGGTVGNGGHVLYGSGAPGDSIGVDGDFYFDTSTSTLYGPKQDGKWPATGVAMTTATVYNGNFNVPDTLSRGHYAMTGAGGAVPLPSDFGVVIPYDCSRVTLTAGTLGKVQGVLDIGLYKVTGSGTSVILAPVGELSCKITNGQQNCSRTVPSGTINHNDKLQVQVDNNQSTKWGGLAVNLACVK
ncbi:hypothetical protein [Cupriavidus oxalaticus]|uniref:Glycine-rich protein n=1 Tax=Cupriavidus oxalaticus TaxID=96344 RepID=A0A375G0K0_9BURK|nr:hypothetical protein [Cupriavidus oxalaticus]QRQ85978.1 hypothetical protein JTE91_22350 [Cupriavidus oxalaticus]QRQ95696.1 hypothetical protein JTE92_19910 [Cupriavidus oxalaticus]WQD84363.1 hypothetical protein U0036_07630 [Cupriavidus oxalaticus]SPC12257.1 Glycine-rich protein [Cupriavidus oxalaticus]